MNTTWFLGSNTSEGFYSYYDKLLSDPLVKQTIILKGGAGCGKSTFMKKLRKAAQSLGADTASFLCSSDPHSLDGLLIMPLGLAVVDGTAPHALEPSLCCCDAMYLNLGAFYDTEKIRAHAKALCALQRRNKACYTAAYEYLRAAACLARRQQQLITASGTQQLRTLADATVHSICPQQSGQGQMRRLFLRAFTPDGLVLPRKTLEHFQTRIVLRDPYGLCGSFLQAALESLHGCGCDCIVCDAPLSPGGQPEAILIPARSTAIFAAPPDAVCAASAEIDLTQYLDTDRQEEAIQLIELNAILQQLAVSQLADARRLHDQMEAIYRPFVDFAGLDLLTQGYLQQLERHLSASDAT